MSDTALPYVVACKWPHKPFFEDMAAFNARRPAREYAMLCSQANPYFTYSIRDVTGHDTDYIGKEAADMYKDLRARSAAALGTDVHAAFSRNGVVMLRKRGAEHYTLGKDGQLFIVDSTQGPVTFVRDYSYPTDDADYSLVPLRKGDFDNWSHVV